MIRYLLNCGAVMLAASAAAETIDYRCPADIATAQRLTEEQSGWRPADQAGRHVLSEAAFSDGAPEGQAWLAPDNEDALGGEKWVARWEFAAPGTWLSCRYRGTSIMLSRQLPDGIKRCSVRVDRSRGVEVQRVWCEAK